MSTRRVQAPDSSAFFNAMKHARSSLDNQGFALPDDTGDACTAAGFGTLLFLPCFAGLETDIVRRCFAGVTGSVKAGDKP